MVRRDIIVVAASAGGVEALIGLVRGLPPGLPAAVFVVLHLPAGSRSHLPAILGRAGSLPADHPQDGDPIQAGKIYVAPPNVHLVLEDGHICLRDWPRENRVRPAADPLFRSAARVFGQRVVGVVLSGTDADGSLGLEAIRLRGGLGIAQDPSEAAFSGMPSSAIERNGVDYVLPVGDIPAQLVRLATDSTPEGGLTTVSDATHNSPEPTDLGELPIAAEKEDGQASGLTCPDCHGSIWVLPEGNLVSLECRVGHRYNTGAFMAAQSARVEDALWTAINVLRERAATLRRLGPYDTSSRQHVAGYYDERARELEEQAAMIHTVVTHLIASDAAQQA